MVYGFMTHSYLHSTEHSQMKQERAAATAEHVRQNDSMTRDEAVKSKRFCMANGACGHQTMALCDWKVAGKPSGTCDEPLCVNHATQVALGKFVGPCHLAEYEKWKKAKTLEQPNLFAEAS
jgi:hypothetical protein